MLFDWEELVVLQWPRLTPIHPVYSLIVHRYGLDFIVGSDLRVDGC